MRFIEIHVVGDGPRDEACLPRLVENLLEREVEVRVTRSDAWKNIRGHGRGKLHGFPRKLLFALRRAQDAGAEGLIAVLDRDRAGTDQLRRLTQARQQERDRGSALPVALGEAIPTGEAWLLDDPTAVSQALDLPHVEIPAWTPRCDPKAEIRSLYKNNPTPFDTEFDALDALARLVELDRCQHAAGTGYAAFAADVEAELGDP